MKNYIKSIGYLTAVILFFVLLSAQAWAVQVTTEAVTQITYNDATASGSITDPWYVTDYGFCWNTEGNPTIADSSINLDVVTQVNIEFDALIPELEPGTTYYLRSYAREWYGTYFYGNVIEFTTANSLPTVTTQAATDIDNKSATGHGTIVDLGQSNPTEHGVCWNRSGNPTIANKKTKEGPVSQVGAFISEIKKLRSNNTYYVRAYATNSYGIAYGNEVTFTTGATLPSVSTQSATDIGVSTATANGTIIDLGAPNPYQHGFCWNTSGMPDLEDFKNDLGETDDMGSFSADIQGLSPNTTYYIRVYATNTAGTSFGGEIVFTTLALTPTVATEAVNDIGPQSATGNGNIIELGSPNPSQHGVCWNTSGNPGLTDNITTEGQVVSTGPFESVMPGLTPATTYYVKAYATNDAGTVYGEAVTFTTDSVPPLVLTDIVTDIGTHSAIGNGQIADLGEPAAYQHGFCWNTTGDPSVLDNKSEKGPVSEIGYFSTLIDNLVPDTTYYARAYAVSAAGTFYGEVASFNTAASASAPVATLSNPPAKITNAAAYNIQVGGIGVIGYKYRINNDNWSTERLVSDLITFELFNEGNVTLSVIGKNDTEMWQSEENPTIVAWHIDITPPEAVLYNYPSGTSNTSGTTIKVGGQDVVSYRYRINGDDWSNTRPTETLINLETLSDGENLLEVIGADYANNWQDEIQATQISWIHDTSVPTAVLDNIPKTVSNQTTAEIQVRHPINGVPVTAYTYTIDDGHTWWSQSVNEAITLSGLNEGEHILCANAYGAGLWQDGQDGMSSIENATCIQWRLDLTPANPILLSVDSSASNGALSHGMPGTASALLSWEWASDDQLETIQRYRIWLSENEILAETLGAATEIFCDLIPGIQGMQEVYSVDGLMPGRQFYFAVKSIDGAGNMSELSNVVALLPEDQLPKINSIWLTAGGLATDNATARELAIEGLNFLETSGCNRVRFESSAWVFDIIAKSGTSNQILADIPIGTPPGEYHIRVINKNGISAVSSEMITITDAVEAVPVVMEIHPLVAEIGMPTVVSIIGKNFDEAGVSANLLTDDDTATPLSSVMVHDSETITAIIDLPETFAEGQYHIQVVNSDGRLNQVSAVKLELCKPIVLQSDTSSLVTTKTINLGIGTIPAKTTLTTDDRSEVSVVNIIRSRIKVFLDSGSAFEIGNASRTEWADYNGNIRPPRQLPAQVLSQDQLGPESVIFTIGIDDFLRLKNDATFFVLIEVPLQNNNNDPAVYYVSPEGELTLAGLEGEWRGIRLEQGGTILAERSDTPETGLTTYTIGLLLNSMSNYAIGSLLVEDPEAPPGYGGDDYGACFVSTLNTANMVIMHGVIIISALVLAFLYLKKR